MEVAVAEVLVLEDMKATGGEARVGEVAGVEDLYRGTATATGRHNARDEVGFAPV